MKIKTRIILIVGPSSQGKTTLAKRLKKELSGRNVVISHDEVLAEVNKNQSQDGIDLQFRLLLINKICDAVDDSRNDHIILDTVNIGNKNLMAFLLLIRMSLSVNVTITLIKLNIPEILNLEYGKKHYPNIENVSELVLLQRESYQGDEGSLKTSFKGLVEFEYIVENPNEMIFV